MKLGFALDYDKPRVALPLERIRRLEDLGYDSVWSAEAYGSDAITVLAFVAAHTRRLRLGTAIMQVAARAPAMAAMQLATLDALAGGGRVIGGLGVSGPQIVEGWYGAPWGRPLERLRDYTLIMKKVFAREAPVEYRGEQINLPYTGADASGMGKPLKSILHIDHPPPIWHGTGAKATVTMTAEVADGWLAFGMRPGNVETFKSWFEEGFRRAGGGKDYSDFEIQGERAGVDHRRCGLRPGSGEAYDCHVRGGHGASEVEFPPQTHAPGGLGAGGGPHSGAVPGRPSRGGYCRSTR